MERSVDDQFVPMLKVKINTGEIDVDNRDEAYWKVKSFSKERYYFSRLKRKDIQQNK